MPAETYTNARFSVSRKPKAPRSASETTNAGTVAPSFATSYKPPCLPKYRTRAKNLQETSMRSRTAFGTPEINQMNANLVSFASVRSTPTAHTKPAGPPHAPQAQDPPTSDQAGTRVELIKHRPIAQHIGATYHQYPQNKVGDTLLRQQAILAINSIPGLIERLHQDISDIRTIRRSTTTSPPEQPDDWHDAEEQPLSVPSQTPSTPVSSDAAEARTPPTRSIDPETAKRVRDLEKWRAKMVGAQLHFDPGKNVKIGAGALESLKKAGLVDATVLTLTQKEAHAKVSEEITRIDEEIESLVG